ncbi:unnamed protein product, partial [Mesorhabditis belari]|uniref:Uncharacterized protein n=1 Tax=Mesorhabditis belari TaxID=2138241 RepID=A0AAF3J4R2_9BILA
MGFFESATPSNRCSSNSIHSVEYSSLNSPSKEIVGINSLIDPSTRYAFCQLTATVLKLDFLDQDDSTSILFCKHVLQAVLEYLAIPVKSRKIFIAYLEENVDLPDVATLIMTIKEDVVVVERGTTLFLSYLLYQFVATSHYDSRTRVLLRHLSTLLAVVWEEFEEAREKIAKSKKLKRYLMIGAAGGVGGVLIGLTGGLAAPLVAIGAGAVLGGAATAAIGTTVGAAISGTTFGVAGAGLAGYKENLLGKDNLTKIFEAVSGLCGYLISAIKDMFDIPIYYGGRYFKQLMGIPQEMRERVFLNSASAPPSAYSEITRHVLPHSLYRRFCLRTAKRHNRLSSQLRKLAIKRMTRRNDLDDFVLKTCKWDLFWRGLEEMILKMLETRESLPPKFDTKTLCRKKTALISTFLYIPGGIISFIAKFIPPGFELLYVGRFIWSFANGLNNYFTCQCS